MINLLPREHNWWTRTHFMTIHWVHSLMAFFLDTCSLHAWVSAWNSVVMKLDSQLDSITGMLLSVDSLPNSLNSFEMQSVCIWKLLLCFSLLGKAYRLVLNICVTLVHYSCFEISPSPFTHVISYGVGVEFWNTAAV